METNQTTNELRAAAQTRLWRSVTEIKKANRAGGFFYWSAATLRHYRGVGRPPKLDRCGIIGGRYLVEEYPWTVHGAAFAYVLTTEDGGRVRRVKRSRGAPGAVHDVNDYKFGTVADARAYARTLDPVRCSEAGCGVRASRTRAGGGAASCGNHDADRPKPPAYFDTDAMTRRRVIPDRCAEPDRVTCGGCDRAWCERCDPGPSALCPWCHGRGYSTAALAAKGGE